MREVVKGINLQIESGELIAIIGPSGCGKSTLLRCLNGLESIDDGTVRIEKTELQSAAQIGQKELQRRAQIIRGQVGMVFQSFNLFPHLTILENLIKAPMVVSKVKKDLAIEKARELLAKVGLSDKEKNFPNQLSGGEQQRAAIARALAMSPKLLLYDEPTSALDPMLVQEVLGVMKQLDGEGMTQIIVTHEMRFARDVADRIIYMEGGQIVEMGSPEQIFANAQEQRTRNFLRHFQ